MRKAESIGFGFFPEESQHHFLAVRKQKENKIVLFERFVWQMNVARQIIDPYTDRAKAELTVHKWELLQEVVRTEFNRRLQRKKTARGQFLVQQTAFGELFGKELMVLVWAIEECDIENIPRALRNWLGLQPEERWWLFTMTNAATGGIDDHFGWRKALRYALTENPISDQRQASLFSFSSDDVRGGEV